jgi:hypothetical protein
MESFLSCSSQIPTGKSNTSFIPSRIFAHSVQPGAYTRWKFPVLLVSAPTNDKLHVNVFEFISAMLSCAMEMQTTHPPDTTKHRCGVANRQRSGLWHLLDIVQIAHTHRQRELLTERVSESCPFPPRHLLPAARPGPLSITLSLLHYPEPVFLKTFDLRWLLNFRNRLQSYRCHYGVQNSESSTCDMIRSGVAVLLRDKVAGDYGEMLLRRHMKRERV